MNVTVWKDILENFCDRTHSQYGIVAIIRAVMITVNKEIWKSFLDFCTTILNKDKVKRKKRELQTDDDLKKRQVSTREQCVNMIGEEFTKKWESLPPNMKVLFAGMSKEEFVKQTSSINSFKVGSVSSTPKKQRNKSPKQHFQAKMKTDKESPSIKPPNMASQGAKKKQHFTNQKPKTQNYQQQKQFFRQAGPAMSKRPAFKSGGEVDPYSLDIAPMNIFENQVIPIGIHNLSKSFRPNLATIRVLSLGMKFIPKTQSLMWKKNFSNFEDFRRRMNNKMFFFVEKTPGIFVHDKTFRIKN